MVKSWLREPLLHFLLIAVALFAINDLVGNRAGQGGRSIVIGPGDIEELRQQFTARWTRPPTGAELASLVEDQIREQVFYHEALALGLDRDDVILRRRLAQKMEFLVADTTGAAEPSDADLRAYLEGHAARYAESPKLSFTHIFFSTDGRGSTARSDAARVLETLQQPSAPERAPELGDRFALHYDYAARSQDELDQEFGTGFGNQVLALTPGQWGGPLVSGYGLHLVRVTERRTPGPVVFEEVCDRVREDFLFDERREGNEASYRRLRAKYSVKVDLPTDAAEVAASGETR